MTGQEQQECVIGACPICADQRFVGGGLSAKCVLFKTQVAKACHFSLQFAAKDKLESKAFDQPATIYRISQIAKCGNSRSSIPTVHQLLTAHLYRGIRVSCDREARKERSDHLPRCFIDEAARFDIKI